MKRTLFDAEYDRVREQAGYTKPRYEFPEPEQPDAGGRVSAERVAAAAADFRERMEALSRHEAEKAAETAAKLKERALETSRRILAREYAAYGLAPPEPPVSLGLLLSMGWKLERVSMLGEDRYELLRPVGKPRPAQEEGEADGEQF